MATPIAVLAADTHLAPRAWAKHPGLHGDSYYSFTQLVDYTIAHNLDLVLAGDLTDKTHPDATTASVIRQQIDRLERNSSAVMFIRGQHDGVTDLPWFNAVSWWPAHVHKKQFGLSCGITGYGIDWTPADAVQEEFDNIPADTQILIAHQVWRDLMGPRIGDSECNFADVPVVDTILTGDFHRHMTMLTAGKSGQTMRILSPGSICMQSIDEDPHKRFFVLCDDMTIFEQSLRTRNCYRFTINTKDDLEVFLTGNVEKAVAPQADVPENIAKNIIHVTYRDEIPEAYARITNAIGTRAHLFLVPIRQKPEVVTIETERRRALADGGLEACLELLVDPKSSLYRDILSLMRSVSPQEQLRTMHASFVKNQGVQDDRGQIHSTEDGQQG